MENKELIKKMLIEKDLYPIENNEIEEDGLVLLTQPNGGIIFSGSADDMIKFADLLVSLALSGENTGQHWHIDDLNMINKKSEIPEIIIMRNVYK